MKILIYILTILFGIACFAGIKKKRYKAMPFLFFVLFFAFAGCGILSVLSLVMPEEEVLLYSLGTAIFGLIFLLLGMWNIHSLRHCREKVDGVYCGSNRYSGGNGMSAYAPVFEYTYNGVHYHEQTAQNVSRRWLNKNMTQGTMYEIYIDPRHPAVFLVRKRVGIRTVLLILFGLLFLLIGMALPLVTLLLLFI